MMHDFADSIVQFLIYICFLLLMAYIVATSFFSALRWLINWVVS